MLEVICGCMFSGKTAELIRRVKRAEFAGLKTQAFKPVIDSRSEGLASHDGSKLEAQAVKSTQDFLDSIKPDAYIIAIDEVQFFGQDIVLACELLSAHGKRVICAGLDLNFRGVPFGPMPFLLAHAERVLKLQAICVICGLDASRTQRLINGQPAPHDGPIVLIGAKEMYQARCRDCYEEGVKD